MRNEIHSERVYKETEFRKERKTEKCQFHMKHKKDFLNFQQTR